MTKACVYAGDDAVRTPRNVVEWEDIPRQGEKMDLSASGGILQYK